MSGLSGLAEITQETIDLTKKVYANEIEKAITVSGTGLVGYNLEAPSKKLYPVVTPLRNRFPRVAAPGGATASNWKEITAINSANRKPAVAEGTRNAVTIAYAKSNRSATYKSFGQEDSVTDEATWQGRSFEDVRAFSALATLQALMISEEALILGGVSDVNTLGTSPTPTLSKTAADGGAWTANSDYVHVRCVALPLYGYILSSLTDLTLATGTLADHAAISADANVQLAVAVTESVTAVVAPVNGAVAYAWFNAETASATAVAAGSMYLGAITTVPAVKMTAPYSTANITGASAATDTSGDALAYDGILSQLLNPTNTLTVLDSTGGGGNGSLKYAAGTGGNAIIYDMTTNATYPTGRTLTSDAAGGIIEFDVVLKALWDRSKVGPTLALISSQEAISITKLVAGSGTGLGWRVELANGGSSDLVGGVYVGGYLNKFTKASAPGVSGLIPFMVHPNMPPGHVLFICERLPFMDSNVPNVWEVELIQEYADFEWARTQRKFEHGVYFNGVLKGFFGAGQAWIRHIKAS